LPLQRLSRYCVAVRSTNNFDLQSVILSDGVQISMHPTLGYVRDGAGEVDVNFAGSPEVGASWGGFERNGAPIHYFFARIFREDNKQFVCDICGHAVANRCSANVSELALVPGVPVFTQVCAVNMANQVSCARSDGFIPDYTAPVPGKVSV
jgi:hypothetical protein